jgi:cytidylate kinase
VGDAKAVAAGLQLDLDATREDLARRDQLDAGRAVDPAVVAAGSLVVDSSNLDLQQTVDILLSIYREIEATTPVEAP